jgi:flagellar hook-associated protein 2
MGNIVFGGLATGMDTSSIIDSLVKLERAPADKLEARKTDMQKRISILSDLSTKLKALGTAAKAVDTPAELRSLKTTVTSGGGTTSELTAASGPDVQPGTYKVKVDRLARAETSRSNGFASKDAGVLAAGSLDIMVGEAGLDSPVTISFGPDDSLDAVAKRINDSAAGVSAAVLFDGTSYRLNISSKETGAASAITFGESGNQLGFEDPASEVVTAQDSLVTVSGTQVSRATNRLTDVVPGITIDLTATSPMGSDGATITVERDPSGQREKVQKMVDAYNDVAKALSSQLTYSGQQKGEDTLFGDSTLQSMQRRMGGILASGVGSGDSQVSARGLGIELQSDGTLKLDATKFDRAVAERPADIEKLLVGSGDDGLASKLSSMIEQLTQSGSGTLATKQEGMRRQMTSFDKQIDRVNSTADAMDTRLRKQFTALEQNVSAMNSNMSYLTSLLYR